MAEKPIKFSLESRKEILHKAKQFWTNCSIAPFRNRLTYNDLIYARELSSYLNCERKLQDARLDNTSMRPIEIPVVQPQVDTLVAQLSDIFLQGFPIFSYVAAPENQESVAALNALQRKHEMMSRRSRELLLYLKDAVRYNFAAAECDWVSGKQPSYTNNISGLNFASVSEEDISYNAIKRLDMYNCFFDEICQFSEIPYVGEFFGYHEMLSHIELRMRLGKLPSDATSYFKEAYESAFDAQLYHVPEIVYSNRELVQPTGFNWNAHFGINVPDSKIDYKNKYVLTTLYFRASGRDIKLSYSDQNKIRVYKALLVNMQYVVYVEEITAAHNLLPIATSRLIDDGHKGHTKSLVESLESVQTLTTQLHTARIADLARAISDKGIYDPALVDSRKINDPSPTAKIPLKPFGQGRNLINSAYAPIPYRNDAASSLISESQIVQRMGEEIAGLNPVQRGSFVKGNKTLGEFQTIMGNAEDRAIVYAILLESQGLFVMKEISKSNILQYQGPTKVFDTQLKREVEIQPQNLRSLIFEFDVADGLQPVSKFTSPEVLTAALQFMSASPQLQAEYDLTKLFSYIFNTRGTVDLNSFKRPTPYVDASAPQPTSPTEAP